MEFMNQRFEEDAKGKDRNRGAAKAQTQRSGKHDPPAVKNLWTLADQSDSSRQPIWFALSGSAPSPRNHPGCSWVWPNGTTATIVSQRHRLRLTCHAACGIVRFRLHETSTGANLCLPAFLRRSRANSVHQSHTAESHRSS